MPLLIETRQERSITVFRLLGSILIQDGASELRRSLLQYLQDGQNQLVLEVHGVHGIDEAGVQTLLSSQAEAKQAGGDLKLAGARYPFIAVLAFHDSPSVFVYYTSSEQALKSFAQPAGNGVRHFDILEFVKEQERELQGAESAKNSSDSTSD